MALSIAEHEDIITLDAELFQVPVRAMPLTVVGISVYLLEITPHIAAVWLKNRHTNRSMHLSQLNKLKRALERERWEINGETIIFDEWGRLIEGQHRLQAVVDTQKTIWSLVVTGIDKERFKTMGQGAKRTTGDILSIRGQRNARNLAAALRWIWRYEQTPTQMLNPHPNITDDELADTLDTHATLVESVKYGTHMTRGVLAPGLATALHYLFAKQHAGRANSFFLGLAKGVQLPEENPVYVLREYFLKRASTKHIMRDELKAPMVILTWNLMQENPDVQIQTANKIIWRGRGVESYPQIGPTPKMPKGRPRKYARMPTHEQEDLLEARKV